MLRGIRRFRRHDSSLPAASGLLFPGALYLLHAAIEHLFRLAFGVLRKQAAQQLSGLNGGFQYAARESEAERRVIFKLLAEVMDDFKMSKNEHQQDNLGKSVKRQSKPVQRWH